MASYSAQLLSGSVNGKPIPVAATATPGTVIHTALPGTTGADEVYLWVANNSGAAVPLTLEWGGTGAGNESPKTLSIPANSNRIQVAFGERANNGVILAAYAGTAGALVLTGLVNRSS